MTVALNDQGWGVGHVVDENDNLKEIEMPSAISSWSEWEVRVPLVLPGERVVARIFKNFDTYSEGDLVKVVTASSHRIEPGCSLAGKCGGCQFQHLSIETQRKWKTEFVRKGLLEQKIDRYSTSESLESLLLPAMGTDEIYGYRSKLTPHYDAPYRENGEYVMGPIGFQQLCSRQIIDVEECPIATPDKIKEKLAGMKTALKLL